ncbi:MAG: hypothetical protein AAFV53_23280 [Myxococcota bacterium]
MSLGETLRDAIDEEMRARLGEDYEALSDEMKAGLLGAIGAGVAEVIEDLQEGGGDDHTHTGDYQPLDDDLTTIAGFAPGAGNLIYSVSDVWTLRSFEDLCNDCLDGLSTVATSGNYSDLSGAPAIGVDVQAHSTSLDTYASHPLTAVQLQQLQAIGATISADQWQALSQLRYTASTAQAVYTLHSPGGVTDDPDNTIVRLLEHGLGTTRTEGLYFGAYANGSQGRIGYNDGTADVIAMILRDSGRVTFTQAPYLPGIGESFTIGDNEEVIFNQAPVIPGLATVATSGDYTDLSNRPVIPQTAADVGADPTGTSAAAISAHEAAANPHPQYAATSALAAVATSGDYNDLSNRPTIPSGGAITAVRTTDLSAPDTTPIDALVLSFSEVGQYTFYGYLITNSDPSSGGAVGFSQSAGVTLYCSYDGALSTGQGGNTLVIDGTGGDVAAMLIGAVSVSSVPATLTIRWAQNTAGQTPSILRTSSWVRASNL